MAPFCRTYLSTKELQGLGCDHKVLNNEHCCKYDMKTTEWLYVIH